MFSNSPTRFIALLATTCLLVAFDCGGDPPPPPVCTPGETQNCACPGGVTGVQTCNSSGTGWGYCAGCSGPATDAGRVCGYPGAPNIACGCWGYATEGERVSAPYCCSGYAIQTRCTGFCAGGLSSWGNICL